MFPFAYYSVFDESFYLPLSRHLLVSSNILDTLGKIRGFPLSCQSDRIRCLGGSSDSTPVKFIVHVDKYTNKNVEEGIREDEKEVFGVESKKKCATNRRGALSLDLFVLK